MQREASAGTAPMPTYEQVLVDAIGVLTEAARLRGETSCRID